MRREQIDVVAERLRREHPELAQPLTWNGLRRLFSRRGMLLTRARVRGRAETMSQDGVSIIAVHSDAPATLALRWAAHEFAHVVLHFVEADEGELVHEIAPVHPDDPREREATYLASCLLRGPGVEVPWPEAPLWRPPVEAPAPPPAPAAPPAAPPSRISILRPLKGIVTAVPRTMPPPPPREWRSPLAKKPPRDFIEHAITAAMRRAANGRKVRREPWPSSPEA